MSKSITTELKTTSFFGRSYNELMKCFGLSTGELKGKQVLECPSGPSAFVHDANRLGIEAIGADPMFYRSPGALEILARSDFREMFRIMKTKQDLFVAKTYASIEEAEENRREAMETFLADYRREYPNGRYKEGLLPNLPFEDKAFDIVLCGHLLFIYESMFDFEFHLKAALELIRVCRGEVRIHPIVGSDGKEYAELGKLRKELEERGVSTEVINVDHEFFKGTNKTLVLNG